MFINLILLKHDYILEQEIKEKFMNHKFHVERLECPIEITHSNLNTIGTSWEKDLHLYDTTVFCCTSASILYDMKTRANFTSASCCITNYLKSKNIEKFHLIVPYVESVKNMVVKYFEAHEFDIASCFTFNQPNDKLVSEITEFEIEKVLESLNFYSCNSVILCCTNFRCVHMLEIWRKKFGINIESSNSSIINYIQTFA